MRFTAAVPFRLTDTRDATWPELHAGTGGGRVRGGEILRIPVAGVRGIAGSARAVAANFTVTGATSAGFVTAFPCGSVPTTSTVNFDGPAAVANGAHIPLSAAGELCVFASNDVHVIVDVNGWWS